MSHNYTKGSQIIGDLKAADDTQRNTGIDFGEDQINLQTSGSTRLQITNTSVKSNLTLKDKSNREIFGGYSYFESGWFASPTSAASVIYIPQDDSTAETSSPTTTNFFIAPYKGRLMGVTLKCSLDLSSTSVTCSFHTGSETASSFSTTSVTTQAVGGVYSYNPHFFDFSSDPNNSIKAGEIYSLGLRVGSGFTNTGNFHYIFHMQFEP